MSFRPILLLFLFLTACGSEAPRLEKVSVLPDLIPVTPHIGGRVLMTQSGNSEKSYQHSWPGVYFEARFSGPSIYAKFDDSRNRYRLTIDGGAPFEISKPGSATYRVNNLGDGPHLARLEKLTESRISASFNGFYLDDEGTPLAPSSRPRQVEFIGNSGMNGFGIRHQCDEVKCTSDEVWQYTDTGSAFAALTARHFDADYQVNAISSIGLIRNYKGVEPGAAMRDIYRYNLTDLKDGAQEDSWQPDVIVIGFNYADFLSPLNQSEKWPDFEALMSDYAKSSVQFVRRLKKRVPDAVILFYSPEASTIPNPELSVMVADGKTTILKGLEKAGITKFAFWTYPDFRLENSGCQGHGNLTDHRKISEFMIELIESQPGLWDQ